MELQGDASRAPFWLSYLIFDPPLRVCPTFYTCGFDSFSGAHARGRYLCRPQCQVRYAF